MEVIREAGFAGPLVVLLFIAGLAVVVRTRSSTSALPFALAILGAGQLGQGLGQHAVRDAIARLPDTATKVDLLNAGTGEAASALLVAGACTLVLCAVAGALSLAGKREA